MKIEANVESVDKALSHSNGNSFEMENVTGAVQRQEVAPGLLTALFSGEANTFNLNTTTVKYDDITETAQLPAGKAFDAKGPDVQKDKPRQLIYEGGSFGIRGNMTPQDLSGKRKFGTDEFMTAEDSVATMTRKMQKGWQMFEELAFAQLLTLDTNITLGGPQTEYNFYTDITGGARPAKVDILLGTNTDVWQTMQGQDELLQTEVEKSMNSSSMTICLCGKDFFNGRLVLERQEGLARDIRGALDLQSMQVPTDSFGSGDGKFNYQYFDSFDGVRYIRYGASINGSKLIADADAYLVPVGADNFMARAYTPAQTMEFVNTEAQAKYGWMKRDDSKGITLWEETNVLYMNRNPRLIRALTSSN